MQTRGCVQEAAQLIARAGEIGADDDQRCRRSPADRDRPCEQRGGVIPPRILHERGGGPVQKPRSLCFGVEKTQHQHLKIAVAGRIDYTYPTVSQSEQAFGDERRSAAPDVVQRNRRDGCSPRSCRRSFRRPTPSDRTHDSQRQRLAHTPSRPQDQLVALGGVMGVANGVATPFKEARDDQPGVERRFPVRAASASTSRREMPAQRRVAATDDRNRALREPRRREQVLPDRPV